jgi:hypothetical protein
VAIFHIARVTRRLEHGAGPDMVLLFLIGNISQPLACMDEYEWRRLVRDFAREAGDTKLARAADPDAWVDRRRAESAATGGEEWGAMNEKLKACPFCGGVATLLHWEPETVACSSCVVIVPVEIWQRRVEPSGVRRCETPVPGSEDGRCSRWAVPYGSRCWQHR